VPPKKLRTLTFRCNKCKLEWDLQEDEEIDLESFSCPKCGEKDDLEVAFDEEDELSYFS